MIGCRQSSHSISKTEIALTSSSISSSSKFGGITHVWHIGIFISGSGKARVVANFAKALACLFSFLGICVILI